MQGNKPLSSILTEIHQNIIYCSNPFRKSKKNSKRKSNKEANARVAKSVKTDQQVKINFLENLLLLKSKGAKLTKVK